MEAIERALESKREGAGILQLMAACCGALNGQMAAVMEGHAQFHVLSPDSRNNSAQGQVANRIYLK